MLMSLTGTLIDKLSGQIQAVYPIHSMKFQYTMRKNGKFLLQIREDLQRANRHFAPSLDDTYVADQRLMLELCISRICAEEQ